jgi:hypothetical protein
MACKVLGGVGNKCVNASIKPEGKSSPDKPRSRCENNNDKTLITEQVNSSPVLQICIQKVLVSNTGYTDWGIL